MKEQNNVSFSYFSRCNSTGVKQAEADFSDCVSGETVMDFGVGYDFKSVMHYPLQRLDNFTINS